MLWVRVMHSLLLLQVTMTICIFIPVFSVLCCLWRSCMVYSYIRRCLHRIVVLLYRSCSSWSNIESIIIISQMELCHVIIIIIVILLLCVVWWMIHVLRYFVFVVSVLLFDPYIPAHHNNFFLRFFQQPR